MTARRPIRIGVLHSTSGAMALEETLLRDAILMEVERVNRAGGLLGVPVEPIVLDPASDWMAYRDMAHAMIHDHGVAAIFGCWTSASRKTVLPVVEEADSLLFYPVQYEGEEQSRNIFYLGATPNQQAIPAVEYMMSAAAGAYSRFFFIGTDYVYPRTTNRILKSFLNAKGLAADAFPELYAPFEHADWSAELEALRAFRAGGRCAVISTINGESNLGFYRALRQAGFAAEDTPVMAFSVSEAELESLDPADVGGHYACWSYLMSHPAAENATHLAAWRVFAGDRPVNDPMEAAIIGFRMWGQAVTEAGTAATAAVRQFMYGQSVTNLSGTRTVMNVNHHTAKPVFIGRVGRDRQFHMVWEAPKPVTGDPWAAAGMIAEARATSAQRDLLDALPTPLLVLDRAGTVRYRSASTQRYFGAEIGDAELAAIRDVARRLAQEPDSHLAEISVRDPSGRQRHMRVAARRMVFAGEEAQLLSLADVTRSREVEEQLRLANEELREATAVAQAADHAKSEFLAMMSHELRTPLNAIIGFSEVIHTELFGPVGRADYKGYAGDIMRSGQHLLSIINDVLDFAKADAGKMILAEEEVPVAKLLQSATRLLRHQADSSGVRLVLDLDEAPYIVRADGRRLRQVLINLIGNAVKFTPSGGRVDVIARLVDRQTVLEIRDTGIGIREQDLPHVIEPFRQAGRSQSRRHGGTGLGLPICDRLVRLHGGVLTLRSTLGHGTTATITLPGERLVAAAVPEDEGRLARG
jgi:urea transport system substrate-binding protein